MKKIMKISFAELNKVMSKPYTYIALIFVIIMSFVCLFVFSPSKRQTETANITKNTFETVTTAFQDKKTDCDNDLTKLCDVLLSMDSNAGIDNIKSNLDALQNMYSNIDTQTEEDLTTVLNQIKSELNNSLTKFDKYLVKKSELNLAKSYTENEISSLIGNDIKSYVENSNYNTLMQDFLKNSVQIPNINKIKQDTNSFVLNKASLKLNFLVDKFNECTDINEMKTIADDYVALSTETEKTMMSFYSLCVAKETNNSNLSNYIGYEDFNDVVANAQFENYVFVMDNNMSFASALNSFTFNQKTGNEAFVHDYIFFSLEIIKFLVLLFSIIALISLTAGEISNKTIKLSLIKPIKRKKFLFAKLNATLMFGIVFLIISISINLIIGFIFYPSSGALMIGQIFGQPLLLSPYLYLLIYFLSIIFELFIYISIALLISILFQTSNIASVVASFVVYITFIICNGLLTGAWFKWLPSSNLNLFKYVTNVNNSNLLNNALSPGVLPTSSWIHSLVYALLILIISNIISFSRFSKKDI